MSLAAIRVILRLIRLAGFNILINLEYSKPMSIKIKQKQIFHPRTGVSGEKACCR